MLTANISFDDMDTHIRGLQGRNIIACFQVLVLMSIWFTYIICNMIVNIVKRDTLLFTRLKNKIQSSTTSIHSIQSKKDHLPLHNDPVIHTNHTLAEDTNLPTVENANDVDGVEDSDNPSNVPTGYLYDEYGLPATETKLDSKSLTDSELQNVVRRESSVLDVHQNYDDIDLDSLNSSTMTENSFQIVFTKSFNLDLYVLYVNFVGLNLWQTFVCFNFAFYNTLLLFITGLFVGWVANLTLKMFYRKTMLLEIISIKWCFIYTCVGTFVLVLAYVNWHTHLDEPNVDSNEYAESYNMNIDHQNTMANAWIFLYVPSMLTGLFWTFVSVDMAFAQSKLHATDNVLERRGIMHDSRRALPTFLLVMIISGLNSSIDTRYDVVMFIYNLTRSATFHLLLLEPMIKFLCLYILIIALERKRHTDLTLSLLITLSFFIVKENAFNSVAIQALSAGIFLFTLHMVKLVQLRFD